MNTNFAQINFDPAKRFLALTRESLIQPEDATQEARQWKEVGNHLEFCLRASRSSIDLWEDAKLPLAALLFVLTLIQTLSSFLISTACVAITVWAFGILPPLLPPLVAGLNLSLGIMAAGFVWPPIAGMCEEAEELARIKRDTRWTLFVALAKDIEQWNEDAIVLRAAEMAMQLRLLPATLELNAFFRESLQRRSELMRRAHLASELLVLGGPLGQCRSNFDRDEGTMPARLDERNCETVLFRPSLSRRFCNALDALGDGVTEAYRRLRGRDS